MNDNTTKLLEQLAAKLGTTTEYLWKVLLKQASISATTELLEMALVLLFGWGLLKAHVKLSKKDDRYSDTLYDELDIAVILPMIIGTVLFAVMLMISLFGISNIVNGYLNPEYWALKEVFNSLR